eukprot:TRINITY_DN471_c0_g1_i2.p1 TRINITY_DN471_c0_g1~~TRINITY_DN471_c0_g1_i2.p1  ORF type:complete len:418 (-),score=95.63 TRINITY_DN471_c0_g1_i2:132-1385(-)
MEKVHRLVDVDVDTNAPLLSPISGLFGEQYRMTLRECVEKAEALIPDGMAYYQHAMFFASNFVGAGAMSVEEVAVINLYTKESGFYQVLNKKLRERNRAELLPLFPFMRLFLEALNKLPVCSGKLWRGVKGVNLSASFPKGKKFFWWGFSSCTVNVNVLENAQFCGKGGTRTLFCVTAKNGRNIQTFSDYAGEEEVLLLPSYFIVNGVMDAGNGLVIIDIQEIDMPFDIFIGIPKGPLKVVEEPRGVTPTPAEEPRGVTSTPAESPAPSGTAPRAPEVQPSPLTTVSVSPSAPQPGIERSQSLPGGQRAKSGQKSFKFPSLRVKDKDKVKEKEKEKEKTKEKEHHQVQGSQKEKAKEKEHHQVQGSQKEKAKEKEHHQVQGNQKKGQVLEWGKNFYCDNCVIYFVCYCIQLIVLNYF